MAPTRQHRAQAAPEARPRRPGPLPISAIPDQDPEVLNRLYGDVATRFAEATGLKVT
ncbi:MAG: hypothetical protein LH477_16885 [Nocardioides sp.]|nr:hypothetical protein [Nocardioides sp.]